ncbi:uncharacterized protein K02A2.6-like [Homarus americanus]|uniref:uncharacterized protein K02A2.6-like n=1 Tax=Homarus americanus TaxID=6706 RepID=UPI001C44A138|nr:uncharacterized protein K02A2.6-like [Homarus americanus]
MKGSVSLLQNQRLQRMREKLCIDSFTARWQKSKFHCIPDALSRAPIQDPSAEDDVLGPDDEDPLHVAVVSALSTVCEEGTPLAPLQDQTLVKVRASAARVADYTALRDVIMRGFPEHRQDLEHALRLYWGARSMLAVDDGLILYGSRLLIPCSLRRESLERLHDGHQGVNRTKRRARQAVYWPVIDHDIENTVSSCSLCRPLLPCHQNEPLWRDDFLLHVDHLSGWPYISSCPRTASAAHLVCVLHYIFADTGVPVALRTDGGPQFTPSTFRRFLARWRVEHRITSPYNPRANGQAEEAVKVMKKLICITTRNGILDEDDFARGQLELRNTPRANGRSPAQVLFRHPLRSSVPAHHRAYAAEWQTNVKVKLYICVDRPRSDTMLQLDHSPNCSSGHMWMCRTTHQDGGNS